MEKHFKNIKRILAYVLFSFLITSCSSELDGVFTWDSFIKKASSDGSTFFAEATAPSGIISFGGSDDSQWSANSKAVRHCSEKSREICRLTRTTTLPKKQNIEIRLETKETHKTEIQKENNGENDWTPHNFAQTELVDELIVRNWGYDQTIVDKMCSDSPLMRGEFTFLGSRKTVKFSGSTSEPLMLYASYIDAPFDYKTYEKLFHAQQFL